jgi:hypothetical protein
MPMGVYSGMPKLVEARPTSYPFVRAFLASVLFKISMLMAVHTPDMMAM